MATLTEPQKRFIVQALACWRTPSEALADVVAIWPALENKLDRRQVYDYHPDRPGRHHAKKWRVLFAATRERYISAQADIGVAHQAFRLDRIQDIAARARQSKNSVLELAALKQAAEETGGAYQRRVEIEHSGKMGVEHSGAVVVKEPETKKEVDDVLRSAGIL